MAMRLKTIAALSVFAGLGGCAGFTPLYAQQGVAGDLHAISIDTPHSRTGYLLHQELEDQLAASKTGAPLYRLEVTLNEKRLPRGLNPDDTPTRFETHLDVHYVLTTTGGSVLLDRTRPVFVSVNAAVQPYASIATQQDSEERVAREAAQIIRTDVALALRPK